MPNNMNMKMMMKQANKMKEQMDKLENEAGQKIIEVSPSAPFFLRSSIG